MVWPTEREVTEVKRGFWIVALVIVMGSLVALTWSYGMMGDEIGALLGSFFATTAAPTETVPVQTVPPQTQPPTTVTEPPTTQEETSFPETTAPETQPIETEEATEPSAVISGLTAANAFVYDTSTGEMLYYQSNGAAKVFPASVTKLFTAYVALRHLDPEQHIAVGDELDLVSSKSSTAGFEKGQSTTVRNLIYGLLLPSGSDAAYILATAAGREIGGSGLTATEAVQVFVQEMNDVAREAGMDGSHFSNPDGFHTGSHYTCLQDLVTIARLAIDTPLIFQAASTFQTKATLDDGTMLPLENTNQLINPSSRYYNEAFLGLKTGHTNMAGYCVVSAVKQEDGYLIFGAFGCPKISNRFADVRQLARHFGVI